ncbi:serine/threonine-protein kinase [Tuwongella immobilis]|uniref:Protein kinase domain-containing protein n=1 Tax=Tuwongella immobilis TaxID=692036 RepID=A0A6C2YRC4_9BACT|nr:serine/threonine-protein kinase [Tuwongella immobilis]VIP04210.1 serine threonine protein kinase : Protein containing Serine/threonine protein kinase OS=Rhodopirellula europaea 6C GN=RE6C_01459 PE=4 SV=1: Pkinase: WD40: WD40: WD40: WD40 [Tuwongella immobilis]VTS05784.1 serine threonine protein kinase : Protein containing Serine/threonine protein kinase OS=Rhodopirellula europaea 6C GN=RE6C_01459 PE=4 SV=1: Pkinase: WD40: WD40: WD40: WD40 [Tuwongella immobilis]
MSNPQSSHEDGPLPMRREGGDGASSDSPELTPTTPISSGAQSLNALFTPERPVVELDPIAFLRSQGYEVLDEIGRGGMGLVLKARQTGMNRLCALKVIRGNRVDSPRVHERFQREVKAAAKLAHPNLVTAFHTNLDGPIKFLAMEFVPGITLVKLVQTQGPQPVPLILDWLRQAAEGLQHSHEHRMVHRDIKPSNLMVTPWPIPPGKKSTLKILDMGLARDLDDDDHGLTQPGELLGTPDYIAPEQADDPRAVDIRTDLYSLGISFFVVLTGRLPFEGTSLVQKIRQHMMEIPPLVHTLRADVPPAVSSMIAKLLAKNPNDRFQTPAELAEACQDLIKGRPPAYLSAPTAETMPIVPAIPGGTSPHTTISGSPTSPAASVPQPVGQPGMMPMGGTAGPSQMTVPTLANGPSSVGSGPAVQRMWLMTGHAGPVRALDVSSDGNYLVSGGDDETLRIWDARTRRPIRQFEAKGGSVSHVQFAPDFKLAMSASLRILEEPYQIDLWEVATGRPKGRLRGLKSAITSACYSRDSKRIVAGSEDGMLIDWTLSGAVPPKRLRGGHSAPVTGVAFLGEGDRVMSVDRHGRLIIWDCTTATEKGRLELPIDCLETIAMAGPRLAFAGSELKLRLHDGTIRTFAGHTGIVRTVVFSSNRKYLLSAGDDGTIRVWNVESGKTVEQFPAQHGRILTLAVAPHLPVLYAAGDDGVIVQRMLNTPDIV